MFWETQMLTHDWLAPDTGRFRLYAAHISGSNGQLRAYAARGPGGRMSVLLLNLSASQPYEMTLRLKAGTQSFARLRGRVQEWQLSSADYQWSAAGEVGRPSLDEPPVHTTWSAGGHGVLLPPYSVTVLRSALD
jgi:hypothetical protein